MFKHLNAEAIKTKTELEQEKAQRWTTFLQKPDRPIPKSKAELEYERRKEIEHRIRLDMMFKKEQAAEEAAAHVDEPTTNGAADADADGPCCDGIHCGTPPCEECDASAAPDETPASTDDNAEANADADDEGVDNATSDDREATPEVLEPPPPPKTAEELLVEKKLSDIQQQLLALSALPVTIQATLDAVSRQLTDLLPTLSKAQPILAGVVDPNVQATEGRQ